MPKRVFSLSRVLCTLFVAISVVGKDVQPGTKIKCVARLRDYCDDNNGGAVYSDLLKALVDNSCKLKIYNPPPEGIPNGSCHFQVKGSKLHCKDDDTYNYISLGHEMTHALQHCLGQLSRSPVQSEIQAYAVEGMITRQNPSIRSGPGRIIVNDLLNSSPNIPPSENMALYNVIKFYENYYHSRVVTEREIQREWAPLFKIVKQLLQTMQRSGHLEIARWESDFWSRSRQRVEL